METRPDGAPLMVCKYCILSEMGHCRKERPLEHEPRYLQSANGVRLRLVFDCQRCEMQVWENA